MGLKSDDKCLAKVGDDEPIFVLRAQDRLAPILVELWADLYFEHGGEEMKGCEALNLADAMRAWQKRTGRAKWPD